jgi:hypothetical protein
MNKDFNDFLDSSKNPPNKISEDVLSQIRKSLNPDHKVVFGKLVLVQGFIGFLSMLFCPQFNMSLTNNFEAFHYFHHTFGEQICMAICGSIFLGSGAVFSSYLLSEGEVNKIHNSRFLYFMSISIISVSIFAVLGAKIYLSMITYWLLGAVITGILFFELNRFIRMRFSH